MQSSQVISIQWTAPDSGGAAITSYAFYSKSSTDATYSLVGETTPSTVFFTKRDIEASKYGKSFDFAVVARTDAGSSKL